MKYIIALASAMIIAEVVFICLTLFSHSRMSAQIRLISDGLFLHVSSSALLPRCVRLEISLRNLYTREICKLRLPKAFVGKSGKDFYFDIRGLHCGVVSAEISEARFGVCTFLFTKKCCLSAEDSLLVMPEALSVSALIGSIFDESADKRTFSGVPLGVHEYQSGDRLGDIHMKLSAKAGKYMVRERYGDGNGLAVISLEAASDCEYAQKNAALLLGAVTSVLSLGGSCRVISGGADVYISGEWELEKAFYSIFAGFSEQTEQSEVHKNLNESISLKIAEGEAVVL